MDPATVLGVAALGIDVSKILYRYARTCGKYSEDVKDTLKYISRLKNTLEIIKTTIDSSDRSPDVNKTVQECLAGCEERVLILKTKIGEIGSPSVKASLTGVRAKMIPVMSRLVYPFKKSALEDLKEKAEESLQLFLDMLQLLQQEDARKLQDRISKSCTRVCEIQADTVANIAVIDGTANNIDKQLSNERVLRWLAAPDPTKDHAVACDLYHPGTCQWLLEAEQYRRWFGGATDSPILWLFGKAGCCKTVMCSMIIEDIKKHIESDDSLKMAYFYFTFIQPDKQGYRSLLLSVLSQLVYCGVDVSELEVARKADRKDVATMERLISTLVRDTSRTYLILDALDECPEVGDARRGLLEGVMRLSRGSPNLRILLTSRNEKDIRAAMDSNKADSMELSADAIGRDIEAYISSEMERDDRLKALPDPIRKQIMQTVAQKADGMFRWAYCHLHEVKRIKLLLPRNIDKALRDFPGSLGYTCAQTLGRFRDNEDVVRTALQWLVFSKRPLTVKELQEACTITSVDHDHTTKINVDIQSRKAMDGLLDLLAPLVTVFQDLPPDGPYGSERGCWTDYVQLAHSSLHEYLVSSEILSGTASFFSLKETECHSFLARSCVGYLHFFHTNPEFQTGSNRRKRITFPLLQYSTQYWSSHQTVVECSLGYEARIDFVTELLRNLGPENTEYDSLWSGDKPFSSVHAGARYNLPVTLNTLLDAGLDGNQLNTDGETPLWEACASGSEKAFDCLMSRKVDCNKASSTGDSPLIAAIERRSTYMITELLKAGANVDHVGISGNSALTLAANNGLEESVIHLLECCAKTATHPGLG